MMCCDVPRSPYHVVCFATFAGNFPDMNRHKRLDSVAFALVLPYLVSDMVGC